MAKGERYRQELSALELQKGYVVHENITPEKPFSGEKTNPCIGLQPRIYRARRRYKGTAYSSAVKNVS